MNIRKAKPRDIEQLCSLYKQLLPNETFDVSKTRDHFETICHDNNYYILVLEENNIIISTCTLVIIKNLTHQNRPYGIIENVITDCHFRGKGYGKTLLCNAIKLAQDKNCHKIMLQTRRTEEYVFNFYCNCGFSSTSSKGFMINLEEHI